MLKSSEWPVKDLPPESRARIAEIEAKLKALPDGQKEEVIQTLQELSMEIYIADAEESQEKQRETDRAGLVASVAKQIEENLKGKRSIILDIFSSEQIAILTLQNEIVSDKVRQCAIKGMEVFNGESLQGDAPTYSISNLEISKKAGEVTVNGLIQTARKYSLTPVLSVKDVDEMLKAVPIGQEHEFLRTRGANMAEGLMDRKITEFLQYIQPMATGRATGYNLLSGYNVHEAVQTLLPQIDYFGREIVEIKATAEDLANHIRRRGHDHPVVKSLAQEFNRDRRTRKFLEKNALTKIVLLTLRGRFEFRIEPGNQAFSGMLEEEMVRELLRCHMETQRQIENTRMQITKTGGKRPKGLKEVVLREVLKKREK